MDNIITRAIARFGTLKAGPQTVQPFTTPAFDGDPFDFLASQRTVTPAHALRLYVQSSSVSTAVDFIASKIEQLPIVLRSSSGDVIDSHPVLDFLRMPNADQTWRGFIGDYCRHWLLTNNAYLFMLGSVNQPPLEMRVVNPTAVSPISDGLAAYASSYQVTNYSGAGAYVRTDGQNGSVNYYDGQLKELAHLRGFSSKPGSIVGDSLLESIVLEIQQNINGKIHNSSLLKRGGRLSMLLNFKGPSSPEKHEARKKEVADSFGGASNAGKIAVTSSDDYSITTLGQSNKDMDYAQLEQTARECIFGRYKIPLALISGQQMTLNNLRQATTSVYDDAITPTADVLLEHLSKALLQRFGSSMRDLSLTYSLQGIPALRARGTAEMMARAGTGLETINELREELPGRDPIDQGQALPRMSANSPRDDVPENRGTPNDQQ